MANTTNKSKSTAVKRTPTSKKTTTAKKTSPAAKKTTTTKKTTTAKKTAAVKKTTPTKTTTKKTTTAKKTTTKKPVAKKTTTVKKTAPKVEIEKKVTPAYEEYVNTVEPEDLIDTRIIEQAESNRVVEEPTFKEETPVIEEVRVERYEETEKPVRVKKRMKKGPKLVLCGLVLIALIAACVICIMKFVLHSDSYKDKATYAESFFIRNKKGKYALFSDKGKQLTDFIYDNAGKFINKTTVVYKENDGYAIIDTEGKEIVKYGKYGYISNYEGIYKVRSDKGYALLDSNGKVILDEENISVSSYGDDYPFIVVQTDKNYIVYMYDGTKIYTFDKQDGAKEPTTNHLDEYGTVFYNGENIIIDLKEKKLLKSFKNDQHFCAGYVTEDKDILSLNACTSWYESLETNGHMLLVNKKNLIDITKECNNTIIYKNTIVCSKENGQYFLEVSKKEAKAGAKLSSRYAFVDESNYILRDDQDYNVVFYKKGKKIKSIDASIAATGLMEEKYYVLYVDNAYEYYNVDGKRVFDKSFKNASAFDENGLARVTEDGNNYYLMNKKGKAVSDKYENITIDGKYYRVKNKNGKYGILDEDGEEIIKPSYENVSIKEIREKYYAVAQKGEKYEVYDLNKKKSIITSKDPITLTDHYIKTQGTKSSYYTYGAKKIYSE